MNIRDDSSPEHSMIAVAFIDHCHRSVLTDPHHRSMLTDHHRKLQYVIRHSALLTGALCSNNPTVNQPKIIARTPSS